MALLEENTFARNDVLPSWWANAIQRALSTGAPSFQIVKQDATHIEVVAGAAAGAALVVIAGKWRWNEATVTRAHPGGAAGTYDIYVTAAANDIVSTPEPGTDLTNYAFALAILEAGHTPTIKAGEVDIYRKVGTLQWSGAEITRIDQTVPLVPTHAHRHASGQPDALSPADIGAAPVAGVTGNFSVNGTFATEKPLDLGAAKGASLAGVGALGDKIGLASSGAAGYGFGIQSGRLVAYVAAAGRFAVRAASGSGEASSGTDAVVLSPTGAIQSFGGPAVLFEGRTASTDTKPYFAVDNKGTLSWGPGGGTATDVALERTGVEALNVTGNLAVAKAAKVEGELVHTGAKVGLFGAAAAVQSVGWGTPTPPGGARKGVLTYESTLKNVIDALETLKLALKGYGILGA